MERAAGDSVITDFLRRNQAEVESIFCDALRRAQSSGELSSMQDPAVLARFFVATIQGMRALARLKSDRRALEEVARVALAVLD
jgi:TetR/AcrR family transcriptional repressor of nem operon